MTDTSHTRHRRWDQPTSIVAAQAIEPRITDLQVEVLSYAYKAGADGFTDLQLAAAFCDTTSTLRTRRAELVQAGKLYDTGRRVRPAGRKREFIVWAHARYREVAA